MTNSNEFDNYSLDQIKDNKYIGRRNILASDPYIEFFTSPHAFLEFRLSVFSWHPQRKFVEFHQKIDKLGWATFDMT